MSKKIIFLILYCILCTGILALSPLSADGPDPVILQAISTKVEASSFKVILQLSGPVKTRDFVLNETGPMLVLDLYNTRHTAALKNLKIDLAPILRLRSAQYKIAPQPITRVVLDLTAKPVYEIKPLQDGLEIVVTLDQASVPGPMPVEAALPAETLPATAPEPTVLPVTPEPVLIAPEPESTSSSVIDAKTSRLFSFDFENADIKDVLYALGLKKGINIIIDEDVTGPITISLNNISFEDSLDTILKIKNLSLTKISDQVIRISKKEKADLVTTFVQLKFGRAEDTAPMLTPLLSGKGNIQVDKRTNSLLITDTLNNIQVITDAISKMDLKPNVVEIKAEIVEVDTNSLRDLGISWTATKRIPGTPDPTATATQSLGNLSINLGTVIDKVQVNATLSMLGRKGKSKLLSSPSITTVDNQAARIIIGDKVPYEKKTISSSAAGETATESTIEFLDIGIKLEVTPTININKQITMKIRPEVSTYTPSTLGPIVHTREAETTIMVNDGQTIVIGGLMSETDNDTVQAVPFVGDIPILGWLFKQTSKTNDKTELLIFITPRLLE
ncbi:MAG: secretin N-terminal domain-containing protein [bacterium]|nr:secretin N-terminal domain-containing protein [bacterium]